MPPRTWPARPPAPEERAAEAAGKAAALECAAEVLRATGLEAEANGLRKPAARLAKHAQGVKPGARLDACMDFVSRAERRLAAAHAEVEAAEAAAAAARSRVDELDAELAEGRRRLDELQNGAPEDRAAHDLMGDVRIFLDAVERAPVAGHVGAGPALPAAALEAGARLRQRCGASSDDRTEEERLEGPLEPSPAAAPAAEADTEATDDEDMSEEVLMDELDGADDDDKALAVARRLQRTRKLGLKTKSRKK